MIIQSEVTGKTYQTVEECLDAEKAYKAQIEAAELEKKEKQEKIDNAFAEICDAWKAYVQTYKDLGYKLSRSDEWFLALEVMMND